MKTKILGQEPAAVLGVVRAALAMLLAFGLFSADTNGVILAVFSAALGLVEAYATKSALYSGALAFGQSLVILAVTFGLQLSDVEQSSLLALLAVALGLFLHDKTSSTDTLISNASPGVTAPTNVVTMTPVTVYNNSSGTPSTVNLSDVEPDEPLEFPREGNQDTV